MNATEFQTERDKRCEAAVKRDILAYQRRRYRSLTDFEKHEHDRLVAASGHEVDRLTALLMNKGWDVDDAEAAAISFVEDELEREFDARGFNDRVRR